MNTPQNPTPSRPPVTRVVIKGWRFRDIALAVGIGLVAVGLVVFAIWQTNKPQKTNKLEGVITEKIATGQREQEISLGFKKGKLDRQVTDTGYHLKVKVRDIPEPYVVPVTKTVWEARKVGDNLEFMRPVSERSY